MYRQHSAQAFQLHVKITPIEPTKLNGVFPILRLAAGKPSYRPWPRAKDHRLIFHSQHTHYDGTNANAGVILHHASHPAKCRRGRWSEGGCWRNRGDRAWPGRRSGHNPGDTRRSPGSGWSQGCPFICAPGASRRRARAYEAGRNGSWAGIFQNGLKGNLSEADTIHINLDLSRNIHRGYGVDTGP